MNSRPCTAWPDAADEILGGDQAVAFAYVTPARGAVVLPLTNTGLRERDRRRLTPVTSSIGVWRKLARIQASPQVAVAYHTRAHGFSDRPEYVLVQGRAALGPLEDRGWIENHLEAWERFAGPREVGLWEPLTRAFHWRIPVEIEVERVLVWPNLACEGEPECYGAPPPADPPGQGAPRKGTGPRIDHRRAARRASRLDHVLLGWVGGDGFPVIAPARVMGSEERGIVVTAPRGAVPAGGRRAGLLAHSFSRYSHGQAHRNHTGWLHPASDGRLVYAPHTEAGYHLPRSRALFLTASGLATTLGLRGARRAGFAPR